MNLDVVLDTAPRQHEVCVNQDAPLPKAVLFRFWFSCFGPLLVKVRKVNLLFPFLLRASEYVGSMLFVQ